MNLLHQPLLQLDTVSEYNGKIWASKQIEASIKVFEKSPLFGFTMPPVAGLSADEFFALFENVGRKTVFNVKNLVIEDSVLYGDIYFHIDDQAGKWLAEHAKYFRFTLVLKPHTDCHCPVPADIEIGCAIAIYKPDYAC